MAVWTLPASNGGSSFRMVLWHTVHVLVFFLFSLQYLVSFFVYVLHVFQDGPARSAWSARVDCRKSVAGRKQSAPQSFVIMCSFHQDRTGTRTDFQPEGTGSSMPIYRSCTRGIDECIEQASAPCRSSPRAAGRSAGNRSPIGRTAHAGLAGSTYATAAEEPDPF